MESEAGLGAEVEQYHASLGFYRSQCKAELTLLLGSVFLVIEKRGANGWWYVVGAKGQHGWAPSDLLEPINDLERHLKAHAYWGWVTKPPLTPKKLKIPTQTPPSPTPCRFCLDTTAGQAAAANIEETSFPPGHVTWLTNLKHHKRPASTKPPRPKLVMIGDAKTGKTCAHFAFAKGSYPELFRPAIFSNYIADVKLDGKDVELELEDTSAHDDYDRLRPLSYPGTHVFMIAFAVDRPDSLEGACSRWVSEVTHHCPEVPVLLVGLKEDLRCDPERVRELVKTGQKPVAYHQGLAAARYIGAAAYVECSAKRGQGLASAFEAATRLALDGRDGVDKAGLLRHRGDGRCSVM